MSDTARYPIPRGWRRVTRGRTRKGDELWGIESGRFLPIAQTNVNERVADFFCVIRCVKKGGAK